jgi:hypothetical protein
VDKIGPYASPLRASWPIVEAPGVRETPLVDTKVDLPPKPVHPKPQAAAPRMKAGEWPKDALKIAQQTNGNPIRTTPCVLRVCHDGTNLCVAVTVPVKAAKKLKLGSKWTADDAAEVCFRDLSGKTPGPIFVIHGFASGKHESVTEAGAPAALAKAVATATQFSTRVENGSWTGEWRIPLQAAGIADKPGLKLGFNVGVRRTETNEWLQWCGSGATHTLDRAGVLTLQ